MWADPIMQFQCVLGLIAFSCLACSGFSQNMPGLTNPQLAFEPISGQSATETRYIALQAAFRLSIDASSITYSVPARLEDSRPGQDRLLRMRWAGVRAEARLEPLDILPGKSNYLVGNDASRWITNVPHYAGLREASAMPGVDLRYYCGPDGQLEYDLIVAPGTDAAGIGLAVEGADRVLTETDGSLRFLFAGREVRQMAPVAYEMDGDHKFPLPAAYGVKDGRLVSFLVSGRTPGRELVIDPVLVYATYFGVHDPLYKWADEGGPGTSASSVAVDPAGNFYITGQTFAYDLTVTAGAYRSTCPDTPADGAACVYTPLGFITKFSKSGQLLYSTYFGGNNGLNPYFQPTGKTLAVDANGYAYVAESAMSTFPTTNGAYQQTCLSPAGCATLTKFNQDGSGLVYSTYFGGSGGDPSLFNGGTFARGLALGATGDVYMVGGTYDATLPTTSGAFQNKCPTNPNGCHSGFVARFNLNTNGPASLVFSSYLGTPGGESEAVGIALDRYGDCYVAGVSNVDMPYLAAFGSGTERSFVAKLSGNYGQALRKATVLRGVTANSIAVDSSLNTFVAGAATNGLATTAGAFRTKISGPSDGFVAKLDPSGYSLLFSTFMGGVGDDSVIDIAVSNQGMAFVTGTTNSSDFPLGPGAFKRTFSTSFIAALNADGRSLYYSSYLGGSGGTSANSIALDNARNAYVAGTTLDSDFPVTPGAIQKDYEQFADAFVTKIVIAGDLQTSVVMNVSSVARKGVVIYHARVTNKGPDGSDNVVFSDAIPAGMSYEGVYVPNGNGCTQPQTGATTGTLTCRKTRLESGQTYYVNVYLRAVGSSGTMTTNKMSASAGTQDLWPSNNSTTASVKIQ